MPVPSSINDLSTAAASNSPPGNEQVFPQLDNYLRFYASCLALLRDRGGGYLTAVSGADTITATLAGASSLQEGAIYVLVPAGTNTGSATLNINSLGAKLVTYRGAALPAGFMIGAIPVVVAYDGTNFDVLADPSPVDRFTAQAIAGVKTFASSPVMPGDATTALQAVPKQQAESIAATAVSDRVRLSLAAAQNTTSGTAINFTGIPSWANRVTVMFDGVSTNGSDFVAVRLGTSDGVDSANYTGTAVYYLGSNNGVANNIGTGVSIPLGSSSTVRVGTIVFTRITGNRWAFSGMVSDAATPAPAWVSGMKALSGVLDRLQITTNNGADTFDAGSASLLIEG